MSLVIPPGMTISEFRSQRLETRTRAGRFALLRRLRSQFNGDVGGLGADRYLRNSGRKG
jgi:hypothetical protein